MRETLKNDQGQTLVVITRKGEYEGMLGLANPKQPGWKTTTVMVGCVGIQLDEADFRLPRLGRDQLLIRGLQDLLP